VKNCNYVFQEQHLTGFEGHTNQVPVQVTANVGVFLVPECKH